MWFLCETSFIFSGFGLSIPLGAVQRQAVVLSLFPPDFGIHSRAFPWRLMDPCDTLTDMRSENSEKGQVSVSVCLGFPSPDPDSCRGTWPDLLWRRTTQDGGRTCLPIKNNFKKDFWSCMERTWYDGVQVAKWGNFQDLWSP